MKKLLVVLAALFFTPLVLAENAEFPGRDLYLDVKYIELGALTQKFEQAIIVDVRSAYEYNTLHIKNARNISLHDRDFISQLQKLRTENPKADIVTYCNGKTCMKSYKAVRKAQQNGINNVLAFDAGIMDWAKTNPQLSVLLGESPLDPARLIPTNTFKARLLEPKDFLDQAGSNQTALIIDARDPLQRDGVAFFIGREKRASLEDNEKMLALIENAAKKNQTVFIYDEAGKQVRWLMYRIEQKGLKNYYFMKGGTKSFYTDIRSEFAAK